jgi:hypothetical protein
MRDGCLLVEIRDYRVEKGSVVYHAQSYRKLLRTTDLGLACDIKQLVIDNTFPRGQ